MSRRFIFLFLLATFVALVPFHSPAPLIYTPGEGWYYETAGTLSHWQRERAKDQLEVAQQAFTDHDYSTALHASHRLLKLWPLSDYAPRAEYLIGRCLEMKGRDELAFKAYENIIQKYPHSGDYEEVLWRQYEIAGRFLNGEWFRLWNTIPFYPSMDETAKLYAKIVGNGPYSDVAPHAQLRIGAAREKAKDYPAAVKAYATAADRYQNQPVIAADAMYREGVTLYKQAATAEYDQGTASQAVAAFTDFITFFPDDRRVTNAQKAIVLLKTEQVRGNFEIAQFYEKSHILKADQKRRGALVYYNEVLQLDPNSRYAAQARQRVEILKTRLQNSPAS
ncbi:MAG TPA: outer membrane protein assembly factor BamD [Verrucomicrobiae bacterium]|nr:outer membrane protein assembly factor BamD [Verrucomicrobiae bacterium]